MSTAQPQSADGPSLIVLIEGFIGQITAQRANDEQRFNGYAQSVDLRFRTLHEDGRRDRRELAQSMEHIARTMRTDQQRAFTAIERRLKDVCDKGGVEHREFRDGILELTNRLNDRDSREAGRGQVLRWIGESATFVVAHGGKIAVIVAALGWVVRQYLPDPPPPAPIASVAEAHAAVLPIGPLELREFQD